MLVSLLVTREGGILSKAAKNRGVCMNPLPLASQWFFSSHEASSVPLSCLFMETATLRQRVPGVTASSEEGMCLVLCPALLSPLLRGALQQRCSIGTPRVGPCEGAFLWLPSAAGLVAAQTCSPLPLPAAVSPSEKGGALGFRCEPENLRCQCHDLDIIRNNQMIGHL